MNKKQFIALANAIREHNARESNNSTRFSNAAIETLADFCKQQNSNFKRERWLSFIAGECGPNGGSIKKEHTKFNCEACGTANCKR